MKSITLTFLALLICITANATELTLGLSASQPEFKAYSTELPDIPVGVQVGSFNYQSQLSEVLEPAIALAPQDEESLKFGIMAGFVLASLAGDNTDGIGSTGSFLIGAYAMFAINTLFSIVPQLYYAGFGASVDESSIDQKLRLGYLVLPILVVYAITSKFRVGLGPYFGFLLSAKDKADDFDEDVKDFVSGFDFGVKLSLMYQVSSYLAFSLSFNRGFANIQDSGSFDQFNQAFMISACYNLAHLLNR